MVSCQITKKIDASPHAVFDLFSDLDHVAEHVKSIKKIERLTPGPVGVGTRFRETRVMFGREATEEMYFTAFEPPRLYEVRCQTCGAEYQSVYTFRPDGAGTVVDVKFEAKPISLFAKLMTPLSFLMVGGMKKCMDQELEDLKKVAESQAVR
jgi:hypothetical protein